MLVSSPPEEPPANVFVPPHPVKSLVHVLGLPLPEESPENVLARPKPEESLKDVRVSAQTESLLETVLVETLPGNCRRVLVEQESSTRVVLSPLKLLLHEVAVLRSFSLKSLFPFLPFWSLSKWWSVFLHHVFEVLYRAPHSTFAGTTAWR